MREYMKKRIGILGITSYPIDNNGNAICAPNNIVDLLIDNLKTDFDFTLFSPQDTHSSVNVINCNLKSASEIYDKKIQPDQYYFYKARVEAILANKAAEMIQNNKLDLIHSHDIRIAPAIFSLSNIPALFTAHGDLEKSYNKNEDIAIYNMFENSPRMEMTAISSQNKDFILKNEIGYAGYTPNGIDTNKFKPNNSPQRGLLFVGRIIKHKKIEKIILIAIKLKQKITLIGPPGLSKDDLEYFDYLKDKYFDHELVNYLGPISNNDLCNHYNEHKALIYFSISEGMPMAILESLASGTPVIASNIGGINDLINENVGCLINNESDFSEIERAIQHVFKIKKATCSDFISKNYSLTKMSENYKKVYNNFMQN